MIKGNMLSRRSLLKASSFLAASAALAPAAATAAPDMPPVLVTLLAEYREASIAAHKSEVNFQNIRRARDKKMEELKIYAPVSGDGLLSKLGEIGRSVTPEYAADCLARDLKHEIIEASEAGLPTAPIRKRYANLRRRLARQMTKYHAALAEFDLERASAADGKAYMRRRAARDAVFAYRPETLGEAALVARAFYEVAANTQRWYELPGRELAIMLNPDLDKARAAS